MGYERRNGVRPAILRFSLCAVLGWFLNRERRRVAANFCAGLNCRIAGLTPDLPDSAFAGKLPVAEQCFPLTEKPSPSTEECVSVTENCFPLTEKCCHLTERHFPSGKRHIARGKQYSVQGK